jgi:hypothetical protein
MLEIIDFYRILQVDPRAEPEVIKAAHRSLARKYHPDVPGGSEERMMASRRLDGTFGAGSPGGGAELDVRGRTAPGPSFGYGPRLRQVCRLVIRPDPSTRSGLSRMACPGPNRAGVPGGDRSAARVSRSKGDRDRRAAPQTWIRPPLRRSLAQAAD